MDVSVGESWEIDWRNSHIPNAQLGAPAAAMSLAGSFVTAMSMGISGHKWRYNIKTDFFGAEQNTSHWFSEHEMN